MTPSISKSHDGAKIITDNEVTKEKMSIPLIVGIIVGILALLAVIMIIIIFVTKKKDDDVASDEASLPEFDHTSVIQNFDDIPITTENPLWATNIMENSEDPFAQDFAEDPPVPQQLQAPQKDPTD